MKFGTKGSNRYITSDMKIFNIGLESCTAHIYTSPINPNYRYRNHVFRK